MKVLTIKEPWASLIINGYKEYEFRSWKTNYRGRILIHAGMSFDQDKIKLFEGFNIEYSKGEIIGEADIIDCIKVDEKFYETLRKKNSIVYNKSGYKEEYAWKLANIKKYKEKIPCKGKLGLWNYNKQKGI